jgi:hypothetical protein
MCTHGRSEDLPSLEDELSILYCNFRFVWRYRMNMIRAVTALAFASILAISTSCIVAGDDPREDPATEAITEATPAAGTQLAVPEGWLIAPASPTCKSQGGVCRTLRLCNAMSGHGPVPASGCPSTTVCCVVL